MSAPTVGNQRPRPTATTTLPEPPSRRLTLTTQPVPQRLADPSTSAQRIGFVHACTFLYATGAGLELHLILRESAFHLSSVGLLRFSGSAAAAGVILALWGLRSLLLRQFGNHRARRTPDDHEFAGMVTSVLMLGFTAVSAVACAALLNMEAWRRFVASHSMLDPAWSAALFRAPPWIGVMLLTGVATATLGALHGWYRGSADRGGRFASFWITVLLGLGLSSAIAALVARPAPLMVVGLLALLGATATPIVAPRNAGRTEPRRSPAATLASSSSMPGLSSLAVLVVAGLATALVVLEQLAHAEDPVRGVLLVVIGAAVGLAVGRRTDTASERRPRVGLLVVAGVALMLLFPVLPTLRHTVVLAASTLLASILVSEARLLARRFGSVQAAAATVAYIGAGSALLLLVAWPWLDPGWFARSVGIGAMVLLWTPATASIRPSPKTAIVATAIVALLLTVPQRRTLPPATQRLAVERSDTWFDHEVGGVERWVPVVPDQPADWSVDFPANRYDGILIRSSHGPSTPYRAAERFVKRCTTALKPGGRLVIDLPAAGFVGAALRLRRSERWEAYLLADEQRQMLLLGRDIPAWLSRRATLPASARLYPITNREQLKALMLR